MAFETILLATLACACAAAGFLVGRRSGAKRVQTVAPAAVPADSRLVATAAHEMRTPLSGVVGAADLLLESGLTLEQRTYAEAIAGSARGMLVLVDELVDLSRIEAGAAGVESVAVPVAGLVEEVAELLGPRAQAKGLDFAVLVGPDAPDEIVGDRARLRQILLNLVGNAVKFTASGGVGLRVDRAADGLRFSVTDTGPGFDPRERERLFQEFGRAAAAPAGGAGLGLAISRRLASAMGGALSAESQPGVGSIFALTLPCWGRDEQDVEREPLKGRRVLVISHQPFSGPWLTESLAAEGAASALAGPDEARVAPPEADDRPDVVIVDRAAGPDLHALASLGRECGAKRLILMLSPAERSDLPRLAEAGFDGYLVKPIRAASLVKLISEEVRMDAPSGGLESGQAVIFPASGGLRVLVAEDDPVSALIALAHLSRLGHASAHVADGLAACETFEREAFDVVLMDLRMPGLDGSAAARRMRALERDSGRAPALVIALTADGGEADAARENGFDHVLLKPLDRRAFETLIAPLAATRAAA